MPWQCTSFNHFFKYIHFFKEMINVSISGSVVDIYTCLHPQVFLHLHTGNCDFNVGFGVISKTGHAKGDFLLQYAGEKLPKQEGEKRMEKSGENKIFFYKHQGKELW